MDYLTLLQLAESPGALELAQVARPSHLVVPSAELMQVALEGGDTTAFDADEVAAAEAAIARLEQLITDASQLMDGYLGRRYRLPLASTPGILVTWARAIVRYKLHKDRITDERTDPIARDYRDALKFLAQVADGDFSLGSVDPEQTASESGAVQFSTGAKVFGRDYLP